MPARLAANRLPGKPLALIGGKPLLEHAVERALESDLGPVLVATEAAVAERVELPAEAQVLLTDPALPSGTDRVAAALRASGLRPDVVVNLQGDLPFVDPGALRACVAALGEARGHISTLAVPGPERRAGAVAADVVWTGSVGIARGFRRGPGRWQHVGIYAFRIDALRRFVAAPPGREELAQRLEQLRAFELGLTVAVGQWGVSPLAVDTPEDLELARQEADRRRATV